jgi:hypothetical protein
LAVGSRLDMSPAVVLIALSVAGSYGIRSNSNPAPANAL